MSDDVPGGSLKEPYRSEPSPVSGAWIEGRRAGQMAADGGDGVVVTGSLFVPAPDGAVVRDLRFGERCYLLGMALFQWWGEWDSARRARGASIQVHGETWRQAWKNCYLQLVRDLECLDAIVLARRCALEQAEDHPEDLVLQRRKTRRHISVAGATNGECL